MSIRLNPLVPLALLVLSVGAASAAPRASRPAPLQPGAKVEPGGRGSTCATPKKKQCLSPRYWKTSCGKAMTATCKGIIEGELKADYESRAAPTTKMLRPNRNELPDDLRTGKEITYDGPDGKANLAGKFPKIRTASVANPGKTTISGAPSSARGAPRNDTKLASLGTTRPNHKLGRTIKKNGLNTLTSDNIFARTGLTRPPHTGLGVDVPYDAHRNPAWESNGNKVASCEEFGYEKVYDWARYTDAVAACSGDKHCELDVAFLPATPGIADRVLRDKDGRPLKTQLSAKKKMAAAKNDMFAMGSDFVYAGGPDGIAPNAKLDQMAADLKKGEVYYATGCKSGCKSNEFKNQWDYHRKLHDRNRTVSDAEFEEYERRKAKFRELVWLWGQAVKREKDKLTAGSPRTVAVWVNPLDMVTADPFERVALMDDIQKTARSAGRTMMKKRGAFVRGLHGAGLRAKPVAAAPTPKATPATAPKGSTKRKRRRLRRGRKNAQPNNRRGGALDTMPETVDVAAPAVGVLGYVKPGAPKPGTQTTNQPKSPASGRTKVKAVNCHPRAFGAKKSELLHKGPISCQIGQFLREEYDRKLRGKKSCLDLDNDDCDWSPSMFEAAFTEGVPYLDEQNAHESECVGYTGDVFDKPKNSLLATEQYIEAMKVFISEAENTLMPYDQGSVKHGRIFGKGWSDADHFGDKDWLAGGYDYDLGWDVHPVKSKSKDVCELGGQARGGFGVDGWFMGTKTEVVDGLAYAKYNEGGSKQTDLHAHLYLFDGAMKPLNERETFTGAWGAPLLNDDIDIPSGYKPGFTVWAGPVPITGAVWGEFFYGARFDVALLAETNPNCDMQAVKLGATAIFTPQLGLNAKAQVGIGISGLLSAGIRGLVNIVTVGVPVTVALSTKVKDITGSAQMMLGFDLDVGLSLSTLSGWLAVYVEFLMFEEEFVFFEWNGVGPSYVSLLGEPLNVELPIFRMKDKGATK